MNIEQKIIAAFNKKADKTELLDFVKTASGDQFIDTSVLNQEVSVSANVVDLEDASIDNDGLARAYDVKHQMIENEIVTSAALHDLKSRIDGLQGTAKVIDMSKFGVPEQGEIISPNHDRFYKEITDADAIKNTLGYTELPATTSDLYEVYKKCGVVVAFGDQYRIAVRSIDMTNTDRMIIDFGLTVNAGEELFISQDLFVEIEINEETGTYFMSYRNDMYKGTANSRLDGIGGVMYVSIDANTPINDDATGDVIGALLKASKKPSEVFEARSNGYAIVFDLEGIRGGEIVNCEETSMDVYFPVFESDNALRSLILSFDTNGECEMYFDENNQPIDSTSVKVDRSLMVVRMHCIESQSTDPAGTRRHWYLDYTPAQLKSFEERGRVLMFIDESGYHYRHSQLNDNLVTVSAMDYQYGVMAYELQFDATGVCEYVNTEIIPEIGYHKEVPVIGNVHFTELVVNGENEHNVRIEKKNTNNDAVGIRLYGDDYNDIANISVTSDTTNGPRAVISVGDNSLILDGTSAKLNGSKLATIDDIAGASTFMLHLPTDADLTESDSNYMKHCIDATLDASLFVEFLGGENITTHEEFYNRCMSSLVCLEVTESKITLDNLTYGDDSITLSGDLYENDVYMTVSVVVDMNNRTATFHICQWNYIAEDRMNPYNLELNTTTTEGVTTIQLTHNKQAINFKDLDTELTRGRRIAVGTYKMVESEFGSNKYEAFVEDPCYRVAWSAEYDVQKGRPEFFVVQCHQVMELPDNSGKFHQIVTNYVFDDFGKIVFTASGRDIQFTSGYFSTEYKVYDVKGDSYVSGSLTEGVVSIESNVKDINDVDSKASNYVSIILHDSSYGTLTRTSSSDKNVDGLKYYAWTSAGNTIYTSTIPTDPEEEVSIYAENDDKMVFVENKRVQTTSRTSFSGETGIADAADVKAHLDNVYTKAQTYNRAEVDGLSGNFVKNGDNDDAINIRSDKGVSLTNNDLGNGVSVGNVGFSVNVDNGEVFVSANDGDIKFVTKGTDNKMSLNGLEMLTFNRERYYASEPAAETPTTASNIDVIDNTERENPATISTLKKWTGIDFSALDYDTIKMFDSDGIEVKRGFVVRSIAADSYIVKTVDPGSGKVLEYLAIDDIVRTENMSVLDIIKDMVPDDVLYTTYDVVCLEFVKMLEGSEIQINSDVYAIDGKKFLTDGDINPDNVVKFKEVLPVSVTDVTYSGATGYYNGNTVSFDWKGFVVPNGTEFDTIEAYAEDGTQWESAFYYTTPRIGPVCKMYIGPVNRGVGFTINEKASGDLTLLDLLKDRAQTTGQFVVYTPSDITKIILRSETEGMVLSIDSPIYTNDKKKLLTSDDLKNVVVNESDDETFLYLERRAISLDGAKAELTIDESGVQILAGDNDEVTVVIDAVDHKFKYNEKEVATVDQVKTELIDNAVEAGVYMETMVVTSESTGTMTLKRAREYDNVYAQYPICWTIEGQTSTEYTESEISVNDTSVDLHHIYDRWYDVHVDITSYTANEEINGLATALDVKKHLSDSSETAEEAKETAETIASGIQRSKSLSMDGDDLEVNTLDDSEITEIFNTEFGNN